MIWHEQGIFHVSNSQYNLIGFGYLDNIIPICSKIRISEVGSMVRKKVDERIRILLENGAKKNHRSLIVLFGDNAKDQVVNLRYMLSKTQVKAPPSVSWCYLKDLGF